MSDKLKAFKIGKDKNIKDDDGGLLGYGESRIQKEHWDNAAKNGETALLAALGLTDKRQKVSAK